MTEEQPGEPTDVEANAEEGEADESASEDITGTTVSGLARLAGVQRSTVQSWMRGADFPPRLPDGSINAFAVGVWWRNRQLSKVVHTAGDPLLSGGDSEALEAYRWQKAMLAGFDVEERRGNLLRRTDIHMALMSIAGIFRNANEAIQRQYGNGPYELFEDAVREAVIRIETEFGTSDREASDGTGDQPEET